MGPIERKGSEGLAKSGAIAVDQSTLGPSSQAECLPACAERPVQVKGGADEGEVGKGLWKVA